MFRFQTRSAHYLVLTAAHLVLTLPNLGAHTFWDMDEGVNAEAGRVADLPASLVSWILRTTFYVPPPGFRRISTHHINRKA